MGRGGDVGCLGCDCRHSRGKTWPGNVCGVQGLRWETSTSRADTELLGPAKMLGYEEASKP